MKRPAPNIWEDLCAGIGEMASALKADGPALFRRVKEEARGWPSSRRGEGGPSSVLDDEGVPMPPVADPTGEAAVSQSPAERAMETVTRHVLTAHEELRRARKAVGEYYGAGREDAKPQAPGCSNHARFGLFAIVFRGGRCRFCYDHRRHDPHLADATEDLVLAHEGRKAERRAS